MPPISAGAAGTTAEQKASVRETRSGAMTLVSGPEHDPATAANGTGVIDAAISGNGRWVAFTSDATNLVPGFVDGNGDGTTDVYLVDTATGDLTLVSHATPSLLTGANNQSDTASLSADGRYLLYTSLASDLVTPFTKADGAAAFDAYVYDRVVGTTTLVSRSPASASTTGNGQTLFAYITPDGRYAVLQSAATDFVPGFVDNNGTRTTST